MLVRADPTDLPRFYFNRSARIWIPYFVAIGLLMAASLLREPVTKKWLECFFYDFTFVFNFFGMPQIDISRSAMPLNGTGAHFWSICAEEQFYLVAPFLIVVLPVGRSALFWGLLAATALVSPFWGYFGAISLGVLFALLRHRLGDWHARREVRVFLTIGAFALFFAMYYDYIPYRVAAPFVAITSVLLFAQAGRHSPLSDFLGGVSYPMYLNHWIGLFIANGAFDRFGLRDTLICQIAGVAISFLVGLMLYLTIDINIRKHRDKYFTGTRGKLCAATGFSLVATGLIGGIILA